MYVNAALGGSGVRFALEESMPVLVSIVRVTVGWEMWMAPLSRRFTCHLRYFSGNPSRLILYLAVRIAWISSSSVWEDAAERKSSMLMATRMRPCSDFL